MPTPTLLCTLILAACLLLACWTDLRQRRIPNLLVLCGMLGGLAINGLAPLGGGLFSFWWGGLGWAQAAFGLLAGLGLFMPLYLMRAVGAGDVKLLAMVGAWLGPQALLGAALMTLLAGGAMALVVMFGSRSTRQVLLNVQMMLTSVVVGASAGKVRPLDAPLPGSVRLPYALAITVGSLAQVGWLLGHAGP